MSKSRDIDDVRRLFDEHIPEVASRGVEIVAIAREKGRRAIVVVRSADPRACPVGVCVGFRGSRIKVDSDSVAALKKDESMRLHFASRIIGWQLELTDA